MMKTLNLNSAINFILFLVLMFAGAVANAQSNNSETSDFDTKTTKLCTQISPATKSATRLNVAVIEFQNLNGKSDDFSRFLCEELTTKLFQTKKFNIVERSQLDKIAIEQKLQLNGPISSESLEKLGKLLGVDAILTGTITNIQYAIRVNARLINISTASVYSVASTDIEIDEMVASLLKIPVPRPRLNQQRNVQSESTKSLDSAFKSSSSATSVAFISDYIFNYKRMLIDSNGNLLCEILVTKKGGSAVLTLGDNRSYSDNSSTTRIVSTSGKTYSGYGIYVNNKNSFSSALKYKFMNEIPTLVTFVFQEEAKKEFENLFLINFYIRQEGIDMPEEEVRLNIKNPY